jgi:hypothetical protein
LADYVQPWAGRNEIAMTAAEVQSLLLKTLARGGDTRLGRGRHYFHEQIARAVPGLGYQAVMEAVWALISRGLAYIDYSQPSADNWSLHLTDSGIAASRDEELTPDDPAGYVRRLQADVPSISAVVRAYTEEALEAYNARLYRSSAVMLGVASEAAILEVATSFAAAMPEAEADKFLEVIQARRQNFVSKFGAFQDKLRSKRDSLPAELVDGIDLSVNAIGDLLRVYRNDAGHPTGQPIDREDCFVHLHMFVRYARKLYLLKAYFDQASGSDSGVHQAAVRKKMSH